MCKREVLNSRYEQRFKYLPVAWHRKALRWALQRETHVRLCKEHGCDYRGELGPGATDWL